jgi:hypothetical protein
MKQLKKMSQRGLLDPEQEDPFALFVASTNIRYCYYNETQNILGNTYGMAVLQVGLYVSCSSSCCVATELLHHFHVAAPVEPYAINHKPG